MPCSIPFLFSTKTIAKIKKIVEEMDLKSNHIDISNLTASELKNIFALSHSARIQRNGNIVELVLGE